MFINDATNFNKKAYMVSNNKVNIDVVSSVLATSFYIAAEKKFPRNFKPVIMADRSELENHFGLIQHLEACGIDLN